MCQAQVLFLVIMVSFINYLVGTEIPASDASKQKDSSVTEVGPSRKEFGRDSS